MQIENLLYSTLLFANCIGKSPRDIIKTISVVFAKSPSRECHLLTISKTVLNIELSNTTIPSKEKLRTGSDAIYLFLTFVVDSVLQLTIRSVSRTLSNIYDGAKSR